MADTIKCPVCGENNPSNQEFCQYCQSRLQAPANSSKGMDVPITPGQTPTKKSTADLEPVLPEWLRNARAAARQSTEEEAAQIARTTSSQPTASEPDLLAGLQSQAEDENEEDVPDWLASITGIATPPPKSQNKPVEPPPAQVTGTDESAQEQPTAGDETPPWLTGMQATVQGSERDEMADWFRQASGLSPEPQSDLSSQSQDHVRSDVEFNHGPDYASDTPDWLRAMAAQENTPSSTPAAASFGSNEADDLPTEFSSDTPDWLRDLSAQENTSNNTSTAATSGADFPKESADNTPAWLRDLSAQSSTPATGSGADATASASDTPDWLSALGGQNQNQGGENAAFPESGLGGKEAADVPISDTPDWLKDLGTEQPASKDQSDDDWLKGLQGEQPAETSASETPAWLKDESTSVPAWLSETQAPLPTPESEPEQSDFGDVPDWLKAAAPQSSIYGETPAEKSPGEMPGQPAEPSEAGTLPPESSSAFAKGATPATPAADTSDSDVDGLFTEMPDWLSNTAETPSSSTARPSSSSDAISPVELPSWVQAMRPVDPGTSQSVSTSGGQVVEQRGALAGLQGVLPAVPGYTPSSKPKAYSIKIQASQEQQSHAALLEQILAAETAPIPIASFSPLRVSRGLRWGLAAVIFAAILLISMLRTQIFSMPVGAPLGLRGALQVAQGIPEAAPVLVAVDYAPSRSGEVEAAAAPMLDQMLLLKHPFLTFISTNEEGPLLAERLISGPLAEHYQSGLQYLNLGYLPGGIAGIRAFAGNPVATAPFDTSLAPAWNVSPLQGITSLSQFAALLILTDDASSARAWIEQTAGLRGSIPVVVISSAQATPMIEPYYASGQISGIVSGLYGGAVFEQNNAGRPGIARTYWDAYSIGMYIAALAILVGGLWNMALGARDRAEKRGMK